MNRGKDHKFSIPHSTVDFVVAAMGAGAAAPTVPLNGKLTPTTATYPIRANGISKLSTEIPTRTSAGLYVITYSHLLPTMLFATGSVVSAGNSPTAALVADVTIIDQVNRKLTVLVSTPAGVATDLGTSDMLIVLCQAQDSSV